MSRFNLEYEIVLNAVRMKKGPMGVYVDRPFFCAIRDNETGATLFMGSIVEP